MLAAKRRSMRRFTARPHSHLIVGYKSKVRVPPGRRLVYASLFWVIFLIVFNFNRVLIPSELENLMKNTKFVVKVIRGGTRAPEYVERIDRSPIQTTTHRKLALIMGRFTAEDAIKSIQTSRCSAELVSVQVCV